MPLRTTAALLNHVMRCPMIIRLCSGKTEAEA